MRKTAGAKESEKEGLFEDGRVIYYSPGPEEIRALDVLRIRGWITRRVESTVLRRRLRADELMVAHSSRHELAVRSEHSWRDKRASEIL